MTTASAATRASGTTGTPSTPPGSMMADRDRLNVRLDSLRLLADNTDGLAVINTNDLDAGAARIVRDLSSYYLLGLLLGQRAARRQVAHDQGASEAPRRGGARAQGLSRPPPRRHARGVTVGCRRSGRRRRRVRSRGGKRVGRRRPRIGGRHSRRPAVAQPGRVLLPRRRWRSLAHGRVWVTADLDALDPPRRGHSPRAAR